MIKKINKTGSSTRASVSHVSMYGYHSTEFWVSIASSLISEEYQKYCPFEIPSLRAHVGFPVKAYSLRPKAPSVYQGKAYRLFFLFRIPSV